MTSGHTPALNRRQFLYGVGLLAGCSTTQSTRAAKPRVVIVGGGVAGVSVLRLLAAEGALDITLVEPKTTYTTCFYSNLYLGGMRSLTSLQYDYGRVASLPRVRVVPTSATAIEPDVRRVVLSNGTALDYDRLVLSPGIALDYTSVPGWSEAAAQRMPHAWEAGSQTQLLEQQLAAVPDGGLIVVIAPPNPYRCPPGPYERVSMMAHRLKSSGRTRTRIVVVDPKTSFSKQPLFQQGWETHYPGMVEWLPPMIHDGLRHVDAASMNVETGFETYRDCALVNVIPRQTAGLIAVRAGLSAADGYCPVDPGNMKSQLDASIFVLGDAAVAGDMPKSAFAAASQAEVVARAIRTDLLAAPAGEPIYHNKCWSLVGPDDSVFVGGRYGPADGKISQLESEISSPDDSIDVRRKNYGDSAAWYLRLTTSLFG